MILEYPDIHFLRAASGWLELKNVTEAFSELNKISNAAQFYPDVLSLNWEINAGAFKWETCVEIAETEVRIIQEQVSGWIHRSFALHELKRTHEALEKVLPAAELFPKDWTIVFNIACYHCQLGDLSAARTWLSRFFSLREFDAARLSALEDPDLKPLWKEIPTLSPSSATFGVPPLGGLGTFPHQAM